MKLTTPGRLAAAPRGGSEPDRKTRIGTGPRRVAPLPLAACGGRSPRGVRSASQRGVTLVIVLMLLVVVTLLGVGAARMAMLAERSARNDRDYQVAWQAAEAALMDAQFDIRGPNSSGTQRMDLFTENNTSVFQPGCNTTAPYLGLCQPAVEGAKPVWASVDFTDDSGTTVEYGTYTGRTFDSGGTGVKPARAPRYMIEWVPDSTPGGSAASGSKPIIYRVTSMGFGPREDVQVVMQMAFKKE